MPILSTCSCVQSGSPALVAVLVDIVVVIEIEVVEVVTPSSGVHSPHITGQFAATAPMLQIATFVHKPTLS